MTFEELIKRLQLSKKQVDQGIARLEAALSKPDPVSDDAKKKPHRLEPYHDAELQTLLLKLGVLPEKK